MIETPVLIVGGGPIGLSLSLVLDRFGIDSVVIERNDTTTKHPKSRGCWARTMEIFRQWGIEDEVRAGGLPPGSDVEYVCENGTGRVFGVSHPEPMTLHSPSQKSMVAQDVVEEALDAVVVKNSHSSLLRRSEMVAFEDHGDYVDVRVRNLSTETEQTFRAKYMIACDGTGSPVRKRLGLEGPRNDRLALLATYHYRADLSHLPHVRRMVGIEVKPSADAVSGDLVAGGIGAVIDRLGGLILATGPGGERWSWVQWRDSEDQPLLSEDELKPLLRSHWGVPDLEIDLLSVGTWSLFVQTPTSFKKGRVLLAGDAAHAFPSTGGMGMNSGIGDVHNLAWKLSLVLQNLAPDTLLDTYTTERRPVAIANTEWSMGNLERRYRWQAALERREEDPLGWRAAIVDLDNHLHSEGIVLGYIYERGALIDDGSPVLPLDPRYYWPTDRPGARFPHMWIDAEATESTLDWFDTSFVLVCGPSAHEWLSAGNAVASNTDIPLVTRTLPWMAGPFTFDSDQAVLVRPDGHVAWRPGAAVDGCKEAALQAALAEIVAGGTESAA